VPFRVFGLAAGRKESPPYDFLLWD
jgi:hypothetical protein